MPRRKKSSTTTTVTKVTAPSQQQMPKRKRTKKRKNKRKQNVRVNGFYTDSGENPSILRHQFAKQHLGDTSEGAAWCLKVLHPCDEATLLYSGIPDKTAAGVVTPEFRTRENITAPAATAGATPTSWDCGIMSLPYPDTPAIYFRRLNTDPVGSWDDGTALTAPLTGDLQQHVMKYRMSYSGTTAHLVANATTDQGMVRATSMATEFTTQDGTTVGTESINVGEGQQWDITAFEQLGPRVYTSEARNGVYVVDRPCEDTYRFTANQAAAVKVFGPSGPGTPPVPDPTPKNLQVAGSPKFPENNFTTSYIMFNGLALTSSIDLKCVRGYEVVPQTRSTLATMMKPSPDYDPQALSMASRVSQKMPAAFPAHYNDFGDILGGIARAISGLGLPIISDIAGALGHVVNPAHYAQPMSVGDALGSVASTVAPLIQRVIRR
nr:MAG: peptidase A21 family protein [Chemarfal virus 91]